MTIIVKKATEVEKFEMQSKPTWECGISEFDWHYSDEERSFIAGGEVTVSYDGGSVTFGAEDYVVFPKGLSCVWNDTKPVKKHYVFIVKEQAP